MSVIRTVAHALLRARRDFPESSVNVVETMWGRLPTCGRLVIGLALSPISFLPPETFPPRDLPLLISTHVSRYRYCLIACKPGLLTYCSTLNPAFAVVVWLAAMPSCAVITSV